MMNNMRQTDIDDLLKFLFNEEDEEKYDCETLIEKIKPRRDSIKHEEC